MSDKLIGGNKWTRVNGNRVDFSKYGEEPNVKFAESNKDFKLACEKANVKPTTRQASKFRNKKGLAYKNSR